MSLNRFGRSPLGAFYRSPLGARMNAARRKTVFVLCSDTQAFLLDALTGETIWEINPNSAWGMGSTYGFDGNIAVMAGGDFYATTVRYSGFTMKLRTLRIAAATGNVVWSSLDTDWLTLGYAPSLRTFSNGDVLAGYRRLAAADGAVVWRNESVMLNAIYHGRGIVHVGSDDKIYSEYNGEIRVSDSDGTVLSTTSIGSVPSYMVGSVRVASGNFMIYGRDTDGGGINTPYAIVRDSSLATVGEFYGSGTYANSPVFLYNHGKITSDEKFSVFVMHPNGSRYILQKIDGATATTTDGSNVVAYADRLVDVDYYDYYIGATVLADPESYCGVLHRKYSPDVDTLSVNESGLARFPGTPSPKDHNWDWIRLDITPKLVQPLYSLPVGGSHGGNNVFGNQGG